MGFPLSLLGGLYRAMAFSWTSFWRGAASTAFLVLCWHLVSLIVDREIIFPGPKTVGVAMGEIVAREDFWPTVGASLWRIGLSFALAFSLAFILGVLAGRYQVAAELLAPLIQLVRSVPTVAIILLVMLWLRSNRAPILVGALIAFPVLYFNVVEGMRSVDEKLLEMAKAYRLGKWRVFKSLYLPSLKSFLGAGAISAMGITIKMVIAAEVFSQPKQGIGTRFQAARIALDTPALFGWALLVVGFSWVIDAIMKKVQSLSQTG